MPPPHQDWRCTKCNFTIFASKNSCGKCGQMRPGSSAAVVAKPGDWTCGSCGRLCFASRSVCDKCNSPKPPAQPAPVFGQPAPTPTTAATTAAVAASPFAPPPMPGAVWGSSSSSSSSSSAPAAQADQRYPRTQDWNCARCNMLVFGSKKACLNCNSPNTHLVAMGLIDSSGNKIINASSPAAPQQSKATVVAKSSSVAQPQQVLTPLSPLCAAQRNGNGGDDDDSTATAASGLSFAAAPPPSRCFKRSPVLDLKTALKALMTTFKAAPAGRPDLASIIPDADDYNALISYLDTSLPSIVARTQIKKLIETKIITQDDVRVLLSYKLEQPYPLYKWVNGFLSSSRDAQVVDCVGPYYTLLYRACEKLPRTRVKAARSVMVKNIPALRSTFDNYAERLKPGAPLNFWSFASFSTKDSVINSPYFMGAQGEDAIIFQVGVLEGVLLDDFSPPGLPSEAEILPLCPAVFRVQASTKVGSKLVVALEHMDNSNVCYVVPAAVAVVAVTNDDAPSAAAKSQ